ncbi:hypothetical protein TSOC_013003 [Tetrabaena socialis]|uniref:Uncharacterized protein n=1 Tax=Tetrabaena socialis TaxID=47790 RepID=A0A2J7ZLH2_9CHLO|nr:hypothetical protein TSOC_013003 [Tetrabaena socialis]|eukprot:PNH01121.1 hypothetical protein TSOC_013003 [Tetrabaena socialis]
MLLVSPSGASTPSSSRPRTWATAEYGSQLSGRARVAFQRTRKRHAFFALFRSRPSRTPTTESTSPSESSSGPSST